MLDLQVTTIIYHAARRYILDSTDISLESSYNESSYLSVLLNTHHLTAQRNYDS